MCISLGEAEKVAPITCPGYSGILNSAIPLLASTKIQLFFLRGCLPYWSGNQCFLLKGRAEDSPFSKHLVVSLVRMWIQFPLLGGIQTHFPGHLPHSEAKILTTGLLQKRNHLLIHLTLKRIGQVFFYCKGERRGLEYSP